MFSNINCLGHVICNALNNYDNVQILMLTLCMPLTLQIIRIFSLWNTSKYKI